MFLVAFSQWFYVVARSINEVVDRDLYYKSRLVKWGVVAVVFVVGFFWILAYINECPDPEDNKGVFKYMDCKPYAVIRGGLEERGLVRPFVPREEVDEFFK